VVAQTRVRKKTFCDMPMRGVIEDGEAKRLAGKEIKSDNSELNVTQDRMDSGFVASQA
jgi:hypothetical protein